MWRLLSLQARLTLLLALVLAAGLLINVGRLVLEAGPRVAAEDRSVVRLAHELIAVLVRDLGEAPDPDVRLARIVGDLGRLRHVRIIHETQRSTPAAAAPRRDAASAPPSWFVRMVQPEQTLLRVPVVVDGRSLGALLIASDPVDEMAEIWNGIVTVEDKRQLAERVVSLQDEERREIARELHDEFGPFLFALRAHGSALLRIAGSAAPDVAAIRSHGEAMLAQLLQLQQLNRRVLERLRPAGLSLRLTSNEVCRLTTA